MEVYASDRRGIVEYKFNNLGYRNGIEYIDSETNAAAFFGSSITSGIGINWSKTFVKLVSDDFQVEPYHFSQGCTAVDNNEILQQISVLKNNTFNPKFWVIQFIDLDRRFDSLSGRTTHCIDLEQNINEFAKIFSKIENMLIDQSWCFIGCDSGSHNIPDRIRYHKNCLTWNPRFIDRSGVGNHPGLKWHQMITLAVRKKLTKS